MLSSVGRFCAGDGTAPATGTRGGGGRLSAPLDCLLVEDPDYSSLMITSRNLSGLTGPRWV
jgi:hypothetical protein